jgi:dipeptidyl aminopeptidase/acylaminoacyl peptidase
MTMNCSLGVVRLLFLALPLWLVAGASAAPPSAADFARRADVQSVVVSPSNSHAALLVQTQKGRVALAVVDLADPGQRRVIAGYEDVDIVEVSWVNDKRLVFSAQQPGPRIEYEMWGSFAIDRDGEDLVHLITARSDTAAATGSNIRYRALPRGWEYWKPVGDGSDDIYVTRWLDSVERGVRPQVVARVNTRSVQLTTLTDGQPAGADRWLFDAKGRLAVVTTTVKDRRALWWKATPADAWEQLHEWANQGGESIEPWALEGDGTLIVGSRQGRDTTALYTYDMRQRRLDKDPLVGAKDFDVSRVEFDTRERRVVGVQVMAQRPNWVWFDDGLAQAQAAIDKALPAGRSNRLLCGHCAGAQRFVVHSTSDQHPGEYYVFEPTAGKLRRLASARPWIDPATQGRRSFHRTPARDGLPLPVVVTHPPGVAADQPARTVVLVHGGPWARGADTRWDAEPQFLATRGYRVLEVSYRGTTGLGWKHERASWGQFGLAMQDDLEDAVLWAVREKLTDPERVCIYGASYGGYAALMGPVKHPGRYRCAASHVGVTDLLMMFSANWTDISPAGRAYGWGILVGDPVKDIEKLRLNSPVNRVADIKVPVLLAQGRLDRRVTPEHADSFVRAARAAGVSVERVDYEEGHGFSRAESEADFWERLDRFLARHLAGPKK